MSYVTVTLMTAKGASHWHHSNVCAAFGVRRSAFGVRRSAFGVRRSAFGLFGVRRLALGLTPRP